uniref:Uncharacterized protein n=1 Tax=Romanomermis culicivorax TaxID=13658 RepID=A0A915IVK1_ROMCU
MVVPPPPHFQVPQFLIMQFQLGQPQYYQQFLVPPGLDNTYDNLADSMQAALMAPIRPFLWLSIVQLLPDLKKWQWWYFTFVLVICY